MSGFYRRFVPNFADVIAPLTNLLKKGVKFVWMPECQRAVETVKAILSCETVLRAPDFAVPFRLEVDTSDLGHWGCCDTSGFTGTGEAYSLLL